MNFQKFTTFKTILIALVLTINANQLFAQATNGIFFQAVARDNFSNPAKDRKIYVQSSIIQTTTTGTKVLTEEHQANTDATGVFSISLGNGVRVGGTASSLATIDWSKGPFYLNLKVAITPIGGNSSWDYTKEWVDMGTTSFGAVPFALYSASSAKVDDKLNVSDTTKMLAVYAKAIKVQSLETAVASKLTAADTLTMLAPYAKAAYTIDSNFFKTQLATKLNVADTIKYTKQKYTDSAISKKLNISDSTIYVTPAQLAAKTFDQTPITNAINTKLNIADSTIYVTPTQLATKTFDTTSLSNRINLKANTADVNTVINLKANTADVTTAISAEAATARAAELTLTNNVASNTSSITANAAAITSEATTARAAELTLTNNVASNTSSITANAVAIANESTTARAAELTLTNNVASNTASITANAAAIANEATTARAAELILTNSVASNTSSITANSAAIVSEAATARAAELVLTNNITFNTASITASASAIELEATTARAAELTLTNNIASNSTSITSINTILSAATSSNTANTLVTRDASGNFSAGSITASNYASTPIGLSYSGSTINWNPTVGANAAITLTQNSTLSFTSTPAVGSYGTVVLTQDGTGGRTITLPTISNVTNKVLGSASNTTVSLSTAASAKDILNFYYDGTNCYWNIGQGYGNAPTASFTLTTTGTGAATLSGTTLNIPSVSSTVNSGSISGTIAVANGGTGASTLTGYVKGTGTTAMTASSNIPVADVTGAAPLASPTFTGTVTTSTINTGALSATSVNTPIYASTPQSLTSGSTISWNPTLGLNANVTLDQNSTLNFSSTPPSGSYGTLVITQDATGGRSITLPSTTNKILGSTSTTSIALSTAAGAKDILNFYYDGTNCFWNIGQGYGTAATSASTNLATSVTGTLAVANGGTGATTLTGLIKGTGTTAFTAAVAGTDYLSPNGSAANLTNFPTFNQNTTGNAATVTTNANLNGDVTSVGNTSTVVKINGTSLASLSTGILKNTTSTGVPTIAVAGSDYQAPISLTTTGTGAATLSGTTLNIPAVSSTVNAGSISGTVAVANGGTGTTSLTGLVKGTGTSALTAAVAGSDYQAPITLTTTGTGAATLSGTTLNIPAVSSTVNAGSISGTVAVANGGTGATSFTANNVLLGNGTSALQVVAPGASGNVLTSNGTTWSSTTPAASGVPYSGASGAVNLGAYNLTVNSLTIGQGGRSSNNNTAIGIGVLPSTTSGNNNTGLGSNALAANTGDNNVGIGFQALKLNTSGGNNIAIGQNAANSNLTGSNNVAIGFQTAFWASASDNITAVGSMALNAEKGAGNTAIGVGAGKVGSGGPYINTTNSTFLGFNTTTGKTTDVTIDNATAIGYGATVTASNLIQLGNTSVTNVKTSGTVTAGDITYPKTHGTANQVLTTTGSGTLTFTTPAVAKPTSDQFTATAAQTSFTLTQTPITNTTVSPNVKPNVWMYINGIRTNNSAYSISGTTVTYTAASNNNYTIVVGDRIQFDYAY